ncbi:uncharacterized protein METZ01_LOCUS98125 [marine metagenome]|uniref:Uncharacterized protein n=1 Tax=marine metagenome TaxID=408172 RepID=A0A381VYU7_9ZZZZ
MSADHVNKSNAMCRRYFQEILTEWRSDRTPIDQTVNHPIVHISSISTTLRSISG